MTAAEAAISSAALAPVPVSEQAPAASPLAALNGYVYFSAKGYTISAPTAVLNKVPATALQQLRAYDEQVNSEIAAGVYVMQADGTAVPAAAPALVDGSVTLDKKGTEAAGTVNHTWSGRHGSVTTHWYGMSAHLDSYLANKVIGGFWVGAGVSLAATELGGAPAIVGIALGTAAGALQLCQASGGSLTVYWLGVIAPGAFVCNPFA